MLVNIEAERARKQLTKEETAKHLGVTTKTYYNWINESVDIPSSKLLGMSKLFGASMEYLLGLCEERR
ncbi:MAG: helix-turn-helix transcriptional regulator [Lachnospiraceae bacterium]|nr:helix-turn-helix transcriptional regulator [Lachnospiraceae bacterium]